MTNTSPPSSGRTYGGLSQAARKEQRRQQFLEAGLTVFGTVGFRKATVRGLCKEAKLTDRYFYSEFGSIEKLLTDVYEYHMTDIYQHVSQALAGEKQTNESEQLIEKAMTAFYDALNDPKVARVCMVELEGVSPEVDELYHSYILRFAKLILSFLKSLGPEWPNIEQEGVILSIAMIGAMRQAGTYWLLNPQEVQKETLIRISTQLFIGVLKEFKGN